MAARRAGLSPRDLAPRPGSPEVDRPPWPVVLRPCLLEAVQDVLRTVGRPYREKTMIAFLEGPAATHGDEPQIPDLGEDHEYARLALVAAKGSGLRPTASLWSAGHPSSGKPDDGTRSAGGVLVSSLVTARSSGRSNLDDADQEENHDDDDDDADDSDAATSCVHLELLFNDEVGERPSRATQASCQSAE
jgi:hypothetical protein